jgi:uncharacterized protein (TIGR02001 family)
MKFTKNGKSLGVLSAAVGMAVAGLAAPLAAQADVTGNIGVFSKYILRGITNAAESDGPAVQGGLDYSHKSGFYAGYWGSSLGYGSRVSEAATTPVGFENDLYAGYKFKAGPVDLNIGAIYYTYTQVLDSDAPEAVLAATFGPVTVGAKYLLEDVAWGNQGDTYFTVDFAQDLPSEFKFAAQLGYYLYTDDGEFIPATAEDSAFRHLNLGISHPFGKTGANMGVTYIVGGKDRQGVQQENAVVLSLTTSF